MPMAASATWCCAFAGDHERQLETVAQMRREARLGSGLGFWAEVCRPFRTGAKEFRFGRKDEDQQAAHSWAACRPLHSCRRRRCRSARRNTTTAPATGEIKIGHTCPYSGPASAYGVNGKGDRGVLGHDQRHRWPINGRKIKFISLDDGYSPPKTVECIRQLVEAGEGAVRPQYAGHRMQTPRSTNT